MRLRPPSLRARFNAEAEALCLSDVVLPELLYGAERSADPPRTLRAVGHFASRLAIVAFGNEAAGHTARIRADQEPRGGVTGPYDLMIAGHARSRGLIVVTAHRGEFQRVQALRREDWE